MTSSLNFLSELVQLKLNIETSVGESTPPSPLSSSMGIAASAILSPSPIGIPMGIAASAILSTGDYRGDYREAEYGVPLPLVEVGVLRLDEALANHKS